MAIYEAQYVGSRILAWENYTSTATPLSAGNLNKIQATLEGIDTNALNAFNVLDQTKADKDTVNGLVNSVQFNDQTGVFTFGQVGGTSITINTVLEKVPASFAYDTQTGKLVIVNTDGTTVQVDLSTVIQEAEFVDSSTVGWTINADGTVSASVKDGSITDAKIEQHYLALLTTQANAAHTSETNADYYAKLSKSYANGTSNLDDRPTENVDNSYYYSQQSKTSSEDSESWAVGTRNGTDVPSTDPAYENNAKYWAQVSEQMSGQAVFEGATSTHNGFRGLVPDPLIADRNKVLKGDGTWGESEGTQQLQNDLVTTQDNIADVEVSPAVAAHAVDEQIIYNNVLYTVMSAISVGDILIVGTNIVESERIVEQLKPFTGATSQNAGDAGTVPQPHAGDQDKVLFGSGGWGALTKALVGLANVANIDQSKAIKNITRSGTTFTVTCLDNTTFTFNQQDNNTTYLAGTGLTLDGTTFKLSTPVSTANGGTGNTTGYVTAGQKSGTTLGTKATCEGDSTIANGTYSHAEGQGTSANGVGSHAEGGNTTAGRYYSHAEGNSTIASANYSHAEGNSTTASGVGSHAEGCYTIAKVSYQTAIGKYNIENSVDANRFIIGKGSSSSRANSFRVNDSGVYGAGAYSSSGADYAELFEWADGNKNNEDRAGKFVTLDGDKIKFAKPSDDHILGVVSGYPSVIGDVFDDQWQGMFMTDIFGRPIYEEVEVEAEYYEIENPEIGEIEKVEISPAHTEIRQKVNPNYDNTTEYKPRTERPEWDAVGVLGKLVCIDDGTCEINGYAKVSEESIATASDERTKFRVMKRLDESHIQIFIM